MKRALFAVVVVLVFSGCSSWAPMQKAYITPRPDSPVGEQRIYGSQAAEILAPTEPLQVYGPQGPAGATGRVGAVGPLGPQGVSGAPGATGSQGAQGAQGPAGARGSDLAWQPFNDVLFPSDKAEIQAGEWAKIEMLAKYMKAHPTYTVELEGYTDKRGTQAHNLKLSTRRVQAVRDALTGLGVPPDRIRIGAYGELNERCVGKDDACWQQSRRVEIIVLPTGDVSASPAAASK